MKTALIPEPEKSHDVDLDLLMTGPSLPLDPEERRVELTYPEVVYLESICKESSDTGPLDALGVRHLVHKIAEGLMAYEEGILNHDKTHLLTLEPLEFWYLRDKVNTYFTVGREPVGLNIKKKLYGLIWKDGERAEKAARLAEWREREKEHGNNSSKDPSESTGASAGVESR